MLKRYENTKQKQSCHIQTHDVVHMEYGNFNHYIDVTNMTCEVDKNWLKITCQEINGDTLSSPFHCFSPLYKGAKSVAMNVIGEWH